MNTKSMCDPITFVHCFAPSMPKKAPTAVKGKASLLKSSIMPVFAARFLVNPGYFSAVRLNVSSLSALPNSIKIFSSLSLNTSSVAWHRLAMKFSCGFSLKAGMPYISPISFSTSSVYSKYCITWAGSVRSTLFSVSLANKSLISPSRNTSSKYWFLSASGALVVICLNVESWPSINGTRKFTLLRIKPKALLLLSLSEMALSFKKATVFLAI